MLRPAVASLWLVLLCSLTLLECVTPQQHLEGKALSVVVMTHNRPKRLLGLLRQLTQDGMLDPLRGTGATLHLVVTQSVSGSLASPEEPAVAARLSEAMPALAEVFRSVRHVQVAPLPPPALASALDETLAARVHGKRNSAANLYVGLACALAPPDAAAAVVLEDDVVLASDAGRHLATSLMHSAGSWRGGSGPSHTSRAAVSWCGDLPPPGQLGRAHVPPAALTRHLAATTADTVPTQQAQAHAQLMAQQGLHVGSLLPVWRPGIASGEWDTWADVLAVPASTRLGLAEAATVTPRLVFKTLTWWVSAPFWQQHLGHLLLASTVWDPPPPPSLRDAPTPASLLRVPGVDSVVESVVEGAGGGALRVTVSHAALPWAGLSRWPGFRGCLTCDNYCYDHLVEASCAGGAVHLPLLGRVSQLAGPGGMSNDTSQHPLPQSVPAAMHMAGHLRWLSPSFPVPGVSTWNLQGALQAGCTGTVDLPPSASSHAGERLWAALTAPLPSQRFSVACPTSAWAAANLSQPAVAGVLVLALVGVCLGGLLLRPWGRRIRTHLRLACARKAKAG